LIKIINQPPFGPRPSEKKARHEMPSIDAQIDKQPGPSWTRLSLLPKL